MGDALLHPASQPARALARARWGSTRLDGLIRELRDRSDELGPPQVAELQSLVDSAGQNEGDETK